MRADSHKIWRREPDRFFMCFWQSLQREKGDGSSGSRCDRLLSAQISRLCLIVDAGGEPSVNQRPKQAIASPSKQTRAFEFGSYCVEHLWTYAARLELADYGTFRSAFWHFSNVFKYLVRKCHSISKDVFAISIR